MQRNLLIAAITQPLTEKELLMKRMKRTTFASLCGLVVAALFALTPVPGHAETCPNRSSCGACPSLEDGPIHLVHRRNVEGGEYRSRCGTG
jgi:hypothetical protein